MFITACIVCGALLFYIGMRWERSAWESDAEKLREMLYEIERFEDVEDF